MTEFFLKVGLTLVGLLIMSKEFLRLLCLVDTGKPFKGDDKKFKLTIVSAGYYIILSFLGIAFGIYLIYYAWSLLGHTQVILESIVLPLFMKSLMLWMAFGVFEGSIKDRYIYIDEQ